ncbi:MAG: aldo/keto reductase, partial [Cyanobacteria bacterium J06626_23]
MLPPKTRRSFLATSLTTVLGALGCSAVRQPSQSTSAQATSAQATSAQATSTPTETLTSAPLTPRSASAPLPQRQLGRTNVQLPILGLGGAGQTPLSGSNPTAAIEQIQRALELGIRYFDTAASYGPSEDYLGQALPPYRAEIFLASKTAARDRDGAWRELERSLRRLNTDYLDLW